MTAIPYAPITWRRIPDGLHQRRLCLFLAAVEGRADEVGKNLGVGLRLENMAFLLELGAERQIILDDAIMNQDEAPTGVEMRMSVLVGDATMGSPARVTDPKMAMGRTCRDDLTQIRNTPDSLANLDASAVDRG